ncbi:MAG: peptidylprolyl isomerase [Dysgonamonadaceae bacterium]|nr:peptidylprolyl isomerase [Dysgonamonadaceae bacterium]
MKISTNKYVTLTYDLHVGEDEERELVEQATIKKPLEFVFGVNAMLEAFENYLEGLEEGDRFSFSIAPEEAYGQYDEDRIVDLPKTIFEVDGEIDEEVLFEGNMVPMMDTEGNRMMGFVVSVGDDAVTMDFNHPLAGETMYFEGTVIGVRDATPEEIAAFSMGCNCEADDCDHDSGNCGSGCNGKEKCHE